MFAIRNARNGCSLFVVVAVAVVRLEVVVAADVLTTSFVKTVLKIQVSGASFCLRNEPIL